jgi:hypothetical protein
VNGLTAVTDKSQSRVAFGNALVTGLPHWLQNFMLGFLNAALSWRAAVPVGKLSFRDMARRRAWAAA